MSKMKFESALRYKEEAFIKFKKDFGHAYGSQTYHLLEFDRFCLAEYLVLCQEKVQIKHAFFMVGLPCQSFCFFF